MRTVHKLTRALAAAALALIPLQVALAKGPPDKVTITGPGIDVPIEIVQSDLLLAFSFYQFNDLTRRVEQPDFELGEGYHITRYVRDNLDESNLITWDRLTYYPDPAGGPGYIFFDGLDPSIGSTEGQGEWFLASEEGGSAMRRILAKHTQPPRAAEQASQTSPTTWLGLIGVPALLAGVIMLRVWRSRKTATTT